MFTNIIILTIKIACYLHLPGVIAKIIIFESKLFKGIKYNNSSKKKILYFKKSIGSQDFKSAFNAIPSKYKIYWINRTYFATIFLFFLKDKKNIINDFNYVVAKTSQQKAEYRNFIKKILKILKNYWSLHGFLSSNFLYMYEREIQNISSDLKLTYICLHKEGIRSIYQRKVQDWIYRNQIGKYNGTAILVYNQDEKKSLINNGLVNAKKVVVTGCPRLDNFFKIKKNKLRKKTLTCFMIQENYGLPIYNKKWLVPYSLKDKLYPKNFDWGFLSKKYYKFIKEFAVKNPDYEIILKTKIGFSEQQLKKFGNLTKNMKVVKGGDSLELIKNSTAVTVFNSTVLLESIAAEKIIFSPQSLLDKKFKNYIIGSENFIFPIEELNNLEKIKKKNTRRSNKKILKKYLGNTKGKCSYAVGSLINYYFSKNDF